MRLQRLDRLHPEDRTRTVEGFQAAIVGGIELIFRRPPSPAAPSSCRPGDRAKSCFHLPGVCPRYARQHNVLCQFVLFPDNLQAPFEGQRRAVELHFNVNDWPGHLANARCKVPGPAGVVPWATEWTVEGELQDGCSSSLHLAPEPRKPD